MLAILLSIFAGGLFFAFGMPILTAHPDLDGTATRTVPIFRAPRAGRLVGATYSQELDADGTKTLTIRNATRGVNMTAALDVAALAALGHAAFVVNQDGTADFSTGDLIVAVYTVNVAGAVAAGEVGIALDVTYGPANDAGIGG